MEKYLLTIEFRYQDMPKYENDSGSSIKKITLGVFDDFDDACKKGNNTMEYLESRFKLHVFPSGLDAKKDRFSKNGGCFGGKKDLISNMAYLKTPFTFYAKITTLKYDSIEQSIDDVLESIKRYKNYTIA